MASSTQDNQELIRSTTGYLIEKYSPSGNRVGWLMIASIFIEAWDLYSISFILVFVKESLHPSSLMLGLASAGVQAGAVVGALIGGWLSDKIGRRTVFLTTMILFIVVGFGQAFVPNMVVLALLRFVLGIPLGTDIANGYTYIMESLPRGKREVMGNRWQFMFAVGAVAATIMVLAFLMIGAPHGLVWRLVLGFSAVPAIVLYFFRRNLPETAVWLVERGRFREAKKVTGRMYGDSLEMLPDNDVEVETPKLRHFLAEIRPKRTARRATWFGWLSCFAQGSEHASFGFFVPLMFVLVGVSGTTASTVINMLLNMLAAVAGYLAATLTPRLGQRRIAIVGFGMTLAALIVTGVAMLTHNLMIVPFSVAIYMWGHMWDASNGMTIASMVAPPKYRGTASGFAYIWVKIPAFLGITLFPVLFDAIGQGASTLLTAVFSLVGLLAAVFVLPEVFGYSEASADEDVLHLSGARS
jgi:MFS family permease